MKLLFKERLFSWLGSYDIYGEDGTTIYTVRGKLAWGHCFKVFDAMGREVGMIKERVMSWMPRFEISIEGRVVGEIRKAFTFFKPKFTIDYMDWQVEGSFTEWNYRIYNSSTLLIATVKKEIFNWTDTYTIDISDPSDSLAALMLVLAIDAEKCSRDH